MLELNGGKITSLATLSVIWQTHNKKCAGQLNSVARKNEWLVLRSLFVFVVGRQHQRRGGTRRKKHIQNKEMDGKYTTNTSEIQLNKQIVCSWSWKSKITKRKVIFEHTNAHTHTKPHSHMHKEAEDKKRKKWLIIKPNTWECKHNNEIR